MAGATRLQDYIDSGLVDGLDALAKATGRKRSAILEQAIRLILDPLPALMLAQETLAAYQARATATDDKLAVIADYVADHYRLGADPAKAD